VCCSLEVVVRRADEQVEILREPRLGVNRHGPAADDEILNVRT